MQSITRLAPRAASAASAVVQRFQPLALATRLSHQRRVAQLKPTLSVSRLFSLTARTANANAENAEHAEPAEPVEHGENSNPLATEGRSNRGSVDATPHGVFVRNMVFDATEEHLKEIFEKFGTIVEAKIVRDPRGLSRGYGFVYFDNEESANRAATQVNGSFWHGRRLMCNPRMAGTRQKGPSSPPGPTQSLYIGNIPYETTDAELNRLFREMDNVKDVRVAVDRVTGWPRGFAHADFADVESAEKAFHKLQGATLGQRELRIDYATELMRRKS